MLKFYRLPYVVQCGPAPGKMLWAFQPSLFFHFGVLTIYTRCLINFQNWCYLVITQFMQALPMAITIIVPITNHNAIWFFFFPFHFHRQLFGQPQWLTIRRHSYFVKRVRISGLLNSLTPFYVHLICDIGCSKV